MSMVIIEDDRAGVKPIAPPVRLRRDGSVLRGNSVLVAPGTPRAVGELVVAMAPHLSGDELGELASLAWPAVVEAARTGEDADAIVRRRLRAVRAILGRISAREDR